MVLVSGYLVCREGAYQYNLLEFVICYPFFT